MNRGEGEGEGDQLDEDSGMEEEEEDPDRDLSDLIDDTGIVYRSSASESPLGSEYEVDSEYDTGYAPRIAKRNIKGEGKESDAGSSADEHVHPASTEPTEDHENESVDASVHESQDSDDISKAKARKTKDIARKERHSAKKSRRQAKFGTSKQRVDALSFADSVVRPPSKPSTSRLPTKGANLQQESDQSSQEESDDEVEADATNSEPIVARSKATSKKTRTHYAAEESENSHEEYESDIEVDGIIRRESPSLGQHAMRGLRTFMKAVSKMKEHTDDESVGSGNTSQDESDDDEEDDESAEEDGELPVNRIQEITTDDELSQIQEVPQEDGPLSTENESSTDEEEPIEVFRPQSENSATHHLTVHKVSQCSKEKEAYF